MAAVPRGTAAVAFAVDEARGAAAQTCQRERREGGQARREGRGGRRAGKGVAIRKSRCYVVGRLVVETLVPGACTGP